ncbi:MAG: NADPH-dependent F420 reductase [Chloroflexota bacterium]
MIEHNKDNVIALIGGTGKEGKGLAYRLAKAGYPIIIGSRDLSKASETATYLESMLPKNSRISGSTNEEAVKKCQIAVLTIPYSAHQITIENLSSFLRDKLVVDVTVPLSPPKITRVQMPAAGSAAQETVLILGENALVAAAFQNISYENLMNDSEKSSCDVLVTGTNKESRSLTLELVKDTGFIGWDAGPIENSVVLEGLTSVLIGINRQYKTTHAGIRITGVDRGD